MTLRRVAVPVGVAMALGLTACRRDVPNGDAATRPTESASSEVASAAPRAVGASSTSGVEGALAVGSSIRRPRRVNLDTPPFRSPPTTTPFDWVDLDGPGGIGLPKGCKLELPVRRSRLPKGDVRYLAPPGREPWLAVAVDADGDGRVDSAGITPLEGGTPTAMPWWNLEAPPSFASGRHGVGLAFAVPSDSGSQQVVMTTKGTHRVLAEGDAVEVVDAWCANGDCAVLTTRVSRVASAGATVLLRRGPGAEWSTIDVRPAGEAPWTPLKIVSIASGQVRVALATDDRVGLWDVADRPELLGGVDTPHGVFEVVDVGGGLVVHAGGRIAETCDAPSFPLLFDPLVGAAEKLSVPAPPTGVSARRLNRGAFVAWIGPLSCIEPNHTVVHGLLVDAAGRPRGAPMPITRSSGFAIATRGDRVDLWIQDADGLVWARGQCEAQP